VDQSHLNSKPHLIIPLAVCVACTHACVCGMCVHVCVCGMCAHICVWHVRTCVRALYGKCDLLSVCCYCCVICVYAGLVVIQLWCYVNLCHRQNDAIYGVTISVIHGDECLLNDHINYLSCLKALQWQSHDATGQAGTRPVFMLHL